MMDKDIKEELYDATLPDAKMLPFEARQLFNRAAVALECRDNEIKQLREAAFKAGNIAETFRPDHLAHSLVADILEAALAEKEPGDE